MNEYYARHARPFLFGKVSPIGIAAAGVAFAAYGLAQGPTEHGPAYNVLMAAGVLSLLLSGADMGIAHVARSRPRENVAARRPGEVRTLRSDRQLLISAVLASVGAGLGAYGLGAQGKVPVAVGLIALVLAGMGALWGSALVAQCRRMTVTLDDSGIRDDSFPFRRRFASWETIASARIFATTPMSAQVVLELEDTSGHSGSVGQGRGRHSHLRIPCQFLTVTAAELLQAITADPSYRPRSEQHSQLGS